MNAKIAPSSSSNNEEKKETSDTKKETKEEKQEDYVTKKCGWLCCGLCREESKVYHSKRLHLDCDEGFVFL